MCNYMGLRSGVSLCWQDCDGDTSQKKLRGGGDMRRAAAVPPSLRASSAVLASLALRDPRS